MSFKTTLWCAMVLTVLAGAAQAKDKTDPLDDFNRTGEQKRCISVGGQIDRMTPLNEHQILFREHGQYYLNNTIGKCNNIDDPFYIIVFQDRTSSLCRNERLTIVDSSSGMTAGFCRLGNFELLEKKAPEEKTE